MQWFPSSMHGRPRKGRPGSRIAGREHLVTALALTGALVLPAPARADVQLDTQLSAAASDNVNLAFEGGNEIEDTLQTASTRFVVTGNTQNSSTNFNGNLQYYRYLKDTFESDVAGGAMFDFTASTTSNRFSWTVTDNYGQQSIDPLELATPGNRNGVNIFRTGPTANFRVGSRNTIGMSVTETLYTIEGSNIDNSRTTGIASFTRQHGSILSTTIGLSEETVDYDDVDGFNFDNRSVFVTLAAAGRRNTVSLTLGNNEVEGAFGTNDGTQYGLQFTRLIGATGNLNFQLTHGFSDAGNLFRLTQRSFIDVGATQDIFATPDPFENLSGFITFSRGSEASSFAVQGFWRDDQYQTQTQFNRNEFGIRLFMRRAVTQNWEVLLAGGSVRRDLQGFRREDDTHIWSAQAMRMIGRTLGVGLRFDRTFRDQDREGLDRKANRFTVFFNYRRQRTSGGRQATQQVF